MPGSIRSSTTRSGRCAAARASASARRRPDRRYNRRDPDGRPRPPRRWGRHRRPGPGRWWVGVRSGTVFGACPGSRSGASPGIRSGARPGACPGSQVLGDAPGIPPAPARGARVRGTASGARSDPSGGRVREVVPGRARCKTRSGARRPGNRARDRFPGASEDTAGDPARGPPGGAAGSALRGTSETRRRPAPRHARKTLPAPRPEARPRKTRPGAPPGRPRRRPVPGHARRPGPGPTRRPCRCPAARGRGLVRLLLHVPASHRAPGRRRPPGSPDPRRPRFVRSGSPIAGSGS